MHWEHRSEILKKKPNPWLFHFNVWQNPPQIKKRKKKKKTNLTLLSRSKKDKTPQAWLKSAFLRKECGLFPHIPCSPKQTTFLSLSSIRFLRSWVPRETRNFLKRSRKKLKFLNCELRILKCSIANIMQFSLNFYSSFKHFVKNIFSRHEEATIMVILNIRHINLLIKP